MFTNNNTEWRCDYCNVLFNGLEAVAGVVWIKEGNNEFMHFCNYDHAAKHFACKALGNNDNRS